MDRHYQLKVTSDTTNIDVSSVDADEVARIVQLAGLNQPTPSMPVSQPTEFPKLPDFSNIPGDDITQVDDMPVPQSGETATIVAPTPDAGLPTDIDQEQLDTDLAPELDQDKLNELADYDHSFNNSVATGEEIDVDDYTWKGQKLPQRTVKGNMGDNALISDLHEHFINEYKRYLEEDSDENDSGILSPLSTPTIPEFDKDPFAGSKSDNSGKYSPMSKIKRQSAKP